MSSPTTIVAERPGAWSVAGAPAGPSDILRCTFTLRQEAPHHRFGYGFARLGDVDPGTFPAKPRLAAPGHPDRRPGRSPDHGIRDRRAPRIGIRLRSRPVPVLGPEPRRQGSVRLLRPRVLRRLHAWLPVCPVARRHHRERAG